jgi:hypothetical protein
VPSAAPLFLLKHLPLPVAVLREWQAGHRDLPRLTLLFPRFINEFGTRVKIIKIGKPPALPGDSKNLTFTGMRLFQNFSFWNSFLGFTGKTGPDFSPI